jgi:hypothetical protein
MPARKRASAGKTTGKLSLAAASRLADNILKDLQPLSQEAAARNQGRDHPFQARSDPETSWTDQPLAIPRIIAWNSVAARGSTTSPSVGVFNPDPNPYSAFDLFAHAFLGSQQRADRSGCVSPLSRSRLSAVGGRD